MTAPRFQFDNSYARDLQGFYLPVQGESWPNPQVLRLNLVLAEDLGLDAGALMTDEGAAILSGATAPDGAEPLAMAYAGHQFGGFSPQLGDGRALLIGEVIDTEGTRRDLHLKGSGRTPFSRGGDGKAALGPVLREYLMGEAMHALGIPTTRALAATLTGEAIRRDGPKPGAVLARVAASHLRVGTFQFFAARGETDRVRQLAEYAIARHYPDLAGAPDRYLKLLAAVRDTQARLIAQWMGVGFIHGVMNTDNMTISGETIDYGPCAFMDGYDPATVFSSIDRKGRYAYGNQPHIAQWNLARLAEALLDLIDPEDSDNAIRLATVEVSMFAKVFDTEWTRVMRAKLGLETTQEGDKELAEALLKAAQGTDFAGLFRAIADDLRNGSATAREQITDMGAFDAWWATYTDRLSSEGRPAADCADAMDRVNPIYIPRNHKVEEALEAALTGEMTLFDRLFKAVTAPFERRDGFEEFETPDPTGADHVTFCGT